MRQRLALLETKKSHHELSFQVSKNLLQLFADQKIDPLKLFVGTYAPYQFEPLWHLAWSEEFKKRTAFPAIQNNNMVYRVSGLDELEERFDFGHKIKGPAESKPEVLPEIVLIPGLAFDASGTRLGRGKGYFDRALENNKTTLKIGVGFEVQLLDSLPQEEHDVKMDFVVTEKRIINCNGVKTS